MFIMRSRQQKNGRQFIVTYSVNEMISSTHFRDKDWGFLLEYDYQVKELLHTY